MNAQEYFQIIVQLNYYEFYKTQNDIRLLWNAIVSMNAVPEFLVLHRRKYQPLDSEREELEEEAAKIRDELGLEDLHFCANALKHVRKIKGRGAKFELQASSTGVSLDDQATWVLDGRDLVEVAHGAFARLQKEFQKLD
jgi:hypothetical protein